MHILFFFHGKNNVFGGVKQNSIIIIKWQLKWAFVRIWMKVDKQKIKKQTNQWSQWMQLIGAWKRLFQLKTVGHFAGPYLFHAMTPFGTESNIQFMMGRFFVVLFSCGHLQIMDAHKNSWIKAMKMCVLCVFDIIWQNYYQAILFAIKSQNNNSKSTHWYLYYMHDNKTR